MKRYRTAVVVLATGVVAAAAVSVGSAGSTATRQRIAIEERFNATASTGTWRVIPLTAGPIERDSGKLEFTGTVSGSAMRNGGKVTLIAGKNTLTGKQGTISLSQRVESADVWLGSGYTADVGTWRFVSGTGAYAGFHGGGRLAAVGLPNGIVLAREEGWVTR